MNSFVILGIHGEDVKTISENVARVRMYVNDQEIDEDFELPHLPKESGIPQTPEAYTYFLREKIEKRMEELSK